MVIDTIDESVRPFSVVGFLLMPPCRHRSYWRKDPFQTSSSRTHLSISLE